MVTVQIGNMVKAGLTKEYYENPEFVANHFIKLWEDSGKGRKAGAAVCISEKGLYHMHMACYGNTTTLNKVSSVLMDSHVEPQLGGKEQLTSYLLKVGEYSEKGEDVLYTVALDVIESKQGSRSDLEEIEAMIDSGMTPEEIFNECFRYRRYEKMIKAHYLSKKIQETPLVKEMWNEWHFGEPGTGKTHTYVRLCEKYSPNEIYLCSDYANSGGSSGGFDFYVNSPTKIVFLDEFRGNIPYNQLLSLLDVYSRNQIHCRYQNTYNLFTSVIIASVYPPEKAYNFMVESSQRNIDSKTQLLRRLNEIVYHYKNADGEFKEYRMSASEYVCAQDMIRKARAYNQIADELVKVEEVKEDLDSVCDDDFLKIWKPVIKKK